MESLTVEKRKVMPSWMYTPVPTLWYNVFTPMWVYALLKNFGQNPAVLNNFNFGLVTPEIRNMFYMLSTMFYQVDHRMFNWHMHFQMLCVIAHLLCVNYRISPNGFPTVLDMICWALEKVPMTDMHKSVCYKFLIECKYKIPYEIIYVETDPYKGDSFDVDPKKLVDELVGSV
jgi:hypothetical protein